MYKAKALSDAHSLKYIWEGSRGYLIGPAAVVLITFSAFRLHFNLAAAGSLYMLVVVILSIASGFWQASLTSLFAVNCLNYFFVEPVFTFRISSPQDWIALAMFETTALAVSRLSARVKEQAQAEARHNVELEKLYELSRRILLIDRRRAAGSQITGLIREIFEPEGIALFDARLARVDSSGVDSAGLETLARSAYLVDSASKLPDRQVSCEVMRLGATPIGGIAFRGPQAAGLTASAIASLAAIALERASSFDNESRAEAARHTEQLRTAVLDALAHAFKSPLTAIRAASSGLLEGGRLTPADTELATLVDQEAQHLTRLTTELLQMAKIDSAEVRLRRERVSALTLIEDALDRHHGQLMNRVVLTPDAAAGLEINGDREILTSALEQFIDNAARYSSPDTAITITAEEKLSEVVIAVHNHGPAIAPHDQRHIFERFYRGEDARHRSPGTGLGLSIAKKSAEAHGGRTWVASNEQDGTTLFLALPRAARRQVETAAGQGTDR